MLSGGAAGSGRLKRSTVVQVFAAALCLSVLSSISIIAYYDFNHTATPHSPAVATSTAPATTVTTTTTLAPSPLPSATILTPPQATPPPFERPQRAFLPPLPPPVTNAPLPPQRTASLTPAITLSTQLTPPGAAPATATTTAAGTETATAVNSTAPPPPPLNTVESIGGADVAAGAPFLLSDQRATRVYSPRSFPIGVVAYNRAGELTESLKSLLAVDYMTRAQVTVYQDGTDRGVAHVASEFGVGLVQRPDTPAVRDGAMRIAQHYKFTLSHLFNSNPNAEYVLVVEDDMLYSPDWLLMFSQTAALYELDRSIACITSWNDNGFRGWVGDPTAMYRTEFFIGLGWLVARKFYMPQPPGPNAPHVASWETRWPMQHWDHAVRDWFRAENLQCVYPEVARNFNIGVKGTHSDDGLYRKYFAGVMLNVVPNVDMGDIRRFARDRYDAELVLQIQSGRVVKSVSELFELTLPPPSTTGGAAVASPAPKIADASIDLKAIYREQQRLLSAQPIVTPTASSNAPASTNSLAVASNPNTPRPALVLYYELQGQHDVAWENAVAPFFGLWHSVPFIRGTHFGVHRLRYTGGAAALQPQPILLIASYSPFAKYRSPTIPVIRPVESFVRPPEKDVIPVTGELGQNCDIVCANSKLACSAHSLQSVNNCDSLRKAFACSKCDLNLGDEQPAIVARMGHPSVGACLASSRPSTMCHAAHGDTRRLCACVPIGGGGGVDPTSAADGLGRASFTQNGAFPIPPITKADNMWASYLDAVFARAIKRNALPPPDTPRHR